MATPIPSWDNGAAVTKLPQNLKHGDRKAITLVQIPGSAVLGEVEVDKSGEAVTISEFQDLSRGEVMTSIHKTAGLEGLQRFGKAHIQAANGLRGLGVTSLYCAHLRRGQGDVDHEGLTKVVAWETTTGVQTF